MWAVDLEFGLVGGKRFGGGVVAVAALPEIAAVDALLDAALGGGDGTSGLVGHGFGDIGVAGVARIDRADRVGHTGDLAPLFAFDVVEPGVEIEAGIDLVDHGGLIHLEADGLEGFGVVGFAAGHDDAGSVFGVGGGEIDLRANAGIKGLGAEAVVAFVVADGLGDIPPTRSGVVDDDDGGVVTVAAADTGELAQGVADIGILVDIADHNLAEGIDVDDIGAELVEGLMPFFEDLGRADIDEGIFNTLDHMEEKVLAE